MVGVQLGRGKPSLHDVHRSTTGSLWSGMQSLFLIDNLTARLILYLGSTKPKCICWQRRNPGLMEQKGTASQVACCSYRKTLGDVLLLYLECGLKDQLRLISSSDGTEITKVLLGDFRSSGSENDLRIIPIEGKTFLMGIHPRLDPKHTMI